MNDPYWTLDTSLFEGTFRYFGKELVQVRGKVHTEQEHYRKSDINQEITPIAIKEGERTYLHLKPLALIPDIILTVGLYRDPRPDGAVGEVVKAQERKMKEVEIGNAQAWSYPDGTLVLWECFLHDFVRYLPLQVDPNMAALWRSVEAFLLSQFPQATQIVTTAFDPMFDRDEYQAFLPSLGYKQVAKAAWGKAIEKQEDAS
jgi:hypothetical protein